MGPVGVGVRVGVSVVVPYTKAFTTAKSPSVGWFSEVKPPTMLAPTIDGCSPKRASQLNGLPSAIAGGVAGMNSGRFRTL